MKASKHKVKTAAEAVKEASRIAKSKEIPRLIRFVEKACKRFPEEVNLWKIWFFACRESKDDYAAALVALDCLEADRHSRDAIQWLNSIITNLNKRNELVLQAVGRVAGQLGLEFKTLLLIQCRDLPAALDAYKNLRLRYTSKTELNYMRIGDLLYKAEFMEAAESFFWHAIAEDPEDTSAIRHLIEAQLKVAEFQNPEKVVEARQLAEALYERYPDSPDALYCMGQAWRAAFRPERAFPYLKEFFVQEPNHAFRSAFTFDLAYLEDFPEAEALRLRKEWAELYGALIRVEGPPLYEDWNPHRKLRIGYVSPDFGRHPVGFFAQTILPAHNSDQVEVFLYSVRDPVSQNDSISKEFQKRVGESHWRWVKELGAESLLKMVRSDRIDVLIDLAGHSKDNRLDVFHNRGAPVQVSWLGAPSTTGFETIDYRISDAIVEPEGLADSFSSERIWRLPNGFHAINFPEDLPEPSPPPILDNGFITFGSFNNARKIGVKTISLWARLLREIPQARMLLKHSSMENFANRESFRSFFVKEGVDPMRVRFQGITNLRKDHFAHYSKLDVALDPVAYNGTTTTCESLYMGVPVLTLKGSNHASRVSASLLHRMGMDGWVAEDEDHYIRIAKAAAARPEALAARRTGMRATYQASALADGPSLARDLEDAYREMWQAKCAEKISESSE